MKKEFFGKIECGNEVHLYTLKNEDAEIKISDLGATVVSFSIFGKDVVGGFDTLGGYIKDDSHQGATIGRVANRIADARFIMDGKEYKLTANNNGNCLHGGCGFDYKMWQVEEYDEESITLTYTSKDGEEGFPSTLHAKVRYILEGTSLIIDYEATPECKTPVSMTNHSYFNLNGFGIARIMWSTPFRDQIIDLPKTIQLILSLPFFLIHVHPPFLKFLYYIIIPFFSRFVNSVFFFRTFIIF